jgi:hypothetical protein
MERQPWECPRCFRIIAPHVDVHDCGEGDGGAAVHARQPPSPAAPPFMVTVNTSGSVLDGRRLFEEIRRHVLTHSSSNAAVFDMQAARQRLHGTEVPSAG